MAPPSSAAALELTVHGLTSSGDGVARLADGRVAFVRDAFPGDVVEARIVNEQARFVNAETVRVLTPSPKRLTSACQVALCGGCALRGYDDAAQSEAKADQVLQAVSRIAKLDAKAVFTGMQRGEPWRYRHRARFHARHDGHWFLGYHARGSHDLVDIDACPVLWPELEASARELGAWLRDQPKTLGVAEVELAFSRRDGRATAAFIQASATSRSQLDLQAPIANVKLRYDQPRDFDLAFTADVFTQANPRMNEKLVDAVLGAVRGERILELHSGIGNFTLPLAAAGRTVHAVEENPASSALAKENAAPFARVTTVNASDRNALADAAGVDCVLMDPPRTGAREAAALLAKKGPPQVVYVSCDPATLARDLRVLVDGGYRLESLATFDMFPQTPHVESLAVLTRP